MSPTKPPAYRALCILHPGKSGGSMIGTLTPSETPSHLAYLTVNYGRHGQAGIMVHITAVAKPLAHDRCQQEKVYLIDPLCLSWDVGFKVDVDQFQLSNLRASPLNLSGPHFLQYTMDREPQKSISSFPEPERLVELSFLSVAASFTEGSNKADSILAPAAATPSKCKQSIRNFLYTCRGIARIVFPCPEAMTASQYLETDFQAFRHAMRLREPSMAPYLVRNMNNEWCTPNYSDYPSVNPHERRSLPNYDRSIRHKVRYNDKTELEAMVLLTYVRTMQERMRVEDEQPLDQAVFSVSATPFRLLRDFIRPASQTSRRLVTFCLLLERPTRYPPPRLGSLWEVTLHAIGDHQPETTWTARCVKVSTGQNSDGTLTEVCLLGQIAPCSRAWQQPLSPHHLELSGSMRELYDANSIVPSYVSIQRLFNQSTGHLRNLVATLISPNPCSDNLSMDLSTILANPCDSDAVTASGDDWQLAECIMKMTFPSIHTNHQELIYTAPLHSWNMELLVSLNKTERFDVVTFRILMLIMAAHKPMILADDDSDIDETMALLYTNLRHVRRTIEALREKSPNEAAYVRIRHRIQHCPMLRLHSTPFTVAKQSTNCSETELLDWLLRLILTDKPELRDLRDNWALPERYYLEGQIRKELNRLSSSIRDMDNLTAPYTELLEFRDAWNALRHDNFNSKYSADDDPRLFLELMYATEALTKAIVRQQTLIACTYQAASDDLGRYFKPTIAFHVEAHATNIGVLMSGLAKETVFSHVISGDLWDNRLPNFDPDYSEATDVMSISALEFLVDLNIYPTVLTERLSEVSPDKISGQLLACYGLAVGGKSSYQGPSCRHSIGKYTPLQRNAIGWTDETASETHRGKWQRGSIAHACRLESRPICLLLRKWQRASFEEEANGDSTEDHLHETRES